jgi:hypothetical protein
VNPKTVEEFESALSLTGRVVVEVVLD